MSTDNTSDSHISDMRALSRELRTFLRSLLDAGVRDWRTVLSKALGCMPTSQADKQLQKWVNEKNGSWKYLTGLKTDWKILVYPCGFQAGILNLARSCSNVYGCGFLPESLIISSMMAREQGLVNIHYVLLDENVQLPFRDKSFDLVFLDGREFGPIDMKSIDFILSETARVTHKNGQICITAPNKYPCLRQLKDTFKQVLLFFRKNECAGSITRSKTEKSVGRRYASIRQWKRYLRRHDLSVSQIYVCQSHNGALEPVDLFNFKDLFTSIYRMRLKNLGLLLRNLPAIKQHFSSEITVIAGKERTKSFIGRLMKDCGYSWFALVNYYVSIKGTVTVEIAAGERPRDRIGLVIPSTDIANAFALNSQSLIGIIRGKGNLSKWALDRIPRIKQKGKFEKQPYLTYNWFFGRPGGQYLNDDDTLRSIIAEAYCFLDELGKGYPFKKLTIHLMKETLFKEYIEAVELLCDRDGDTGRFQALVNSMVEELAEVSLRVSYLHGDFGINNIIVDDKTRRIGGVIDWEFGSPYQVTAIDYFQLILSVDRHRRSQSYGSQVVEYMRDGLKDEWTAEYINEVLCHLGVDPGHLTGLMLLYWLHTTARQSSLHHYRYFDREWKQVNVYQMLDAIGR